MGPPSPRTATPGGAAGPSSTVLQVVKSAVLAPYGHKGREVHRIPLVQELVPLANLQAKILLVDPPEGKQTDKRLRCGNRIEGC